jgi:hypothetical protein
MGNLRQKYLSELVALLEKNKFSVAPRKKDKISFPIELENNELQKSFGYGVEFLQYVNNSEDCKVFLHETRRYLIISRLDPKYKYKKEICI